MEERFVVTIHDWEENEHYPLGVYSTRAKAGEAMEGTMAAEHGLSEFTDWKIVHPGTGVWLYFYEGFTVEITRHITDQD